MGSGGFKDVLEDFRHKGRSRYVASRVYSRVPRASRVFQRRSKEFQEVPGAFQLVSRVFSGVSRVFQGISELVSESNALKRVGMLLNPPETSMEPLESTLQLQKQLSNPFKPH